MRARGLKREKHRNAMRLHSVAPHAGAWIETSEHVWKSIMLKVAPHAGAWIETCLAYGSSEKHGGRAPCGRHDALPIFTGCRHLLRADRDGEEHCEERYQHDGK